MALDIRRNLPHFLLQDTATSRNYQATPGRGSATPHQNQQTHGTYLQAQLANLQASYDSGIQLQELMGLHYKQGAIIEVEGFNQAELRFEDLEKSRNGIELRSLRVTPNESTAVTLFIPPDGLTSFTTTIENYTIDARYANNRRKYNIDVINTIQHIRIASFVSLWTDTLDVFPQDPTEAIWWEVWLPVDDDRNAALDAFRELCDIFNIPVSERTLDFPDRSVINAYCSTDKLSNNFSLLNMIAEIRRAKETAEFFTSLASNEQTDWLNDLSQRTNIPATNANTPYICLLDQGLNIHPVLDPFVETTDLHAYNPAWGIEDECGHGTELAGLALFGDMTHPMSSKSLITVAHRLESVKILSDMEYNKPALYGSITADAIARVHISHPNRKRIYNMAVSAKDSRDRGRPSTWSAAVDNIAYDALESGKNPKLMILCAGNTSQSPTEYLQYPDWNTTDAVHDPGQAWNALTVGACTHKTNITERGAGSHYALAKSGSLSPYSTTSLLWFKTHWPAKPDIVFEGGNLSCNGIDALQCESLSLLTLNYQHSIHPLSTSYATSAATALCSKMAAEIMVQYPHFWPETVRGLIIHSAEWTENMKRDFLDARARKGDYHRLMHYCGYGEPNLNRAQWSASNSLSLIYQDTLSPFKLNAKKNIVYNQINTHALPWPKDELAALGNTIVTMRVTLSHFIEGNPGVCFKGYKGRYLYESHGLRFDVKKPGETDSAFLARLTELEDETLTPSTGTGSSTSEDLWIIGSNARNQGSISSDIWTGPAIELVDRGMLGVYPVRGWWKTAKKHMRYNRKVRYTLIVSIITPETDTEIYTTVERLIAKMSIATPI